MAFLTFSSTSTRKSAMLDSRARSVSSSFWLASMMPCCACCLTSAALKALLPRLISFWVRSRSSESIPSCFSALAICS
jgi:hypothetical protein